MNRGILLWCAAFLALSLSHGLCAQEKKLETAAKVQVQTIVRIDSGSPRPSPFFHGHNITLLDLHVAAGRENRPRLNLPASTLRLDGFWASHRVGPFNIKFGYVRMPMMRFAPGSSLEKNSAFPAGTAKRGGLGLQIRW